MNKPLVIFDLDGTLLDTQASLAEAFNRALAELNAQTRAVEEFRYIIGDGARVAASRCLPADRQSEEEVELCLERFKYHYDSTWSQASPYEGIADMLEALRPAASLAVLSNKDDVFTQQCIAHYFPESFDLVLGHKPEFGLKPDPAGALHLINSLSASTENSLFVGDMAIDMQTARRCDLAGVGVLWGFRDEPELTSAGARHIIRTPAELIHLVAEL